jgi:hypothetical protein
MTTTRTGSTDVQMTPTIRDAQRMQTTSPDVGGFPPRVTSEVSSAPTLRSKASSDTSRTDSFASADLSSETLPAADQGIAPWGWAIFGVAAICCVLVLLYFIGFASLPKKTEDEARLEALITELEEKHPDVDFDEVRKEIYAQVPPNLNSGEYAKLPNVEAQMLVDEAVKLHDTDNRKSVLLNPPFRGMFRSGDAPSSTKARGHYGLMPRRDPQTAQTDTKSLEVHGYGPVRTDSQYGVLPNRAREQLDGQAHGYEALNVS